MKKIIIAVLAIIFVLTGFACANSPQNVATYGGVLYTNMEGVFPTPQPMAKDFTGYRLLRGGDAQLIETGSLARAIDNLADDRLKSANVFPRDRMLVKGAMLSLYVAYFARGTYVTVTPLVNRRFFREGIRICFAPISDEDRQLFSVLSYSEAQYFETLKQGAIDFGVSVGLPVTFVDATASANVTVVSSREPFDKENGYHEAIGYAHATFGLQPESDGRLGVYTDIIGTQIDMRIEDVSTSIYSSYALLPQSALTAYTLHQYRNVFRHEIGHLAGFAGGYEGSFGHTMDPTSVMYASTASNYMTVRSAPMNESPAPREIVLLDDPALQLRFLALPTLTPFADEPTAKVLRAIGAVLSFTGDLSGSPIFYCETLIFQRFWGIILITPYDQTHSIALLVSAPSGNL